MWYFQALYFFFSGTNPFSSVKNSFFILSQILDGKEVVMITLSIFHILFKSSQSIFQARFTRLQIANRISTFMVGRLSSSFQDMIHWCIGLFDGQTAYIEILVYLFKDETIVGPPIIIVIHLYLLRFYPNIFWQWRFTHQAWTCYEPSMCVLRLLQIQMKLYKYGHTFIPCNFLIESQLYW